MVVEENGKWFVKSESGDKQLGGPYDTKAEAEKRLGQIEYFKRHDGEHRQTLYRLMGVRALGNEAAKMDMAEVMRRVLAKDGVSLDGESAAYIEERFRLDSIAKLRTDDAEPHFFTHCMTSIAPGKDISDPEAFCAWLTNQVTGLWPSQGG